MSTPTTTELADPTADLPRAGLVTSRGETIIAPTVVEKIATRAASEVDGVGGVLGTGLSRLLPWTVGSGGPARASAEVGAETVTVDLTVNVLYPEPVAAVTNRVRAEVIRRLAELCGLRATEVNIAVPGLVEPPRRTRRRVE
ncbi:MAG TPA: Asp23/Gls24 family envelope stress response protein [Acidimicrobiales bacterium]|nr:Asp23/Gls24 family envelope stress response protein [Acidimicrobiales bacterium]